MAYGFFILLIVELIHVQMISHRYYFDLSRDNRIRVVPLEGRRGNVFDRNGIILAENRPSFNVSVIPQEIKNESEFFDFLAEALQVSASSLQKRFQARKFAPFAPVLLMEDISRKTAIALEENRFHFPGLIIEEGFRRNYPFGDLYAHVLGYVGKADRLNLEKLKEYGYTAQNTVGKSGVEEYYDSYLRGGVGGLQIEVNSRGQQIRMLSLKSPSAGQDLQLTLDHRIQQIAAQLLSGRQGAIIVMDLDNGEILSLLSSPAFDPNVFSRPGMTQADAGYMFSNPSSPLLNRAISGQYPPGSVFKVIVSLAGLETEKIKPETTFFCPGYHPLGEGQFRCSHIHGDQDLSQAIAHSCNVYFFYAGSLVGAELMQRYARMLGLGYPTYIDLPYESSGHIPSPIERKLSRHQGWYKGDTFNMAIGQGEVLATPLQLIRMMATVANEGREVHPHVIRSIGAEAVHKYAAKNFIHLKQQNFQLVLEGLKSTVKLPTGTAHLLDLDGMAVSGKTGTAQSSGNRDNHAWFVGFAQSEKNRIVFCVFLEFGGSSLNAVEISRDLLLRLQQEAIL